MKFISLFFFVAAMTATWTMSRVKRDVPESVHVGIQDDLRAIIANLLREKAPASQNLRFERFYTQNNGPARVTAHFSYAFNTRGEDGDSVRTRVSGSAVLNKTGETDDQSAWSVDELKLHDSAIEFTEPVQITAVPIPPKHE